MIDLINELLFDSESFVIFLGCLLILMAIGSRWRSGGRHDRVQRAPSAKGVSDPTVEEQEMLAEALRGLSRMEKRIANLETILMQGQRSNMHERGF